LISTPLLSFQAFISFSPGLILIFLTQLFRVELEAICALQMLLMIDREFGMRRLSSLFHYELGAKVCHVLDYQVSLV